MAKITLRQLVKVGACREQRAEFARRFGRSVVVTPELAAGNAGVFDWGWASRYLLSAAAYAEYEKVRDTAWAEYEKARDTAWAEYEKARDTAYAEYEKARDTAYVEYAKTLAAAWDQYEKACAPAYAEYKKVRDAADAEYEKVLAITFARLYNCEHEGEK